MLKISEARKVFNRGKVDEKIALDSLSLHLFPGEFGVVIGSNGAGKSSMLGAISGALALDSGQVFIGGCDVTRQAAHQRASRLARVFQDPMRGTAASMTVAENMLLADLRGKPRTLGRGLGAKRRKLYAERLEILGLGLEDRLDTEVGTLSGGQRQSLSLIMAVAGAPDVLLLDEHTAALDPRTADRVMTATVRAVKEFKLTTLMVTHDMRHAVDFGDRVILLDAGKVHVELTGEKKRNIGVSDLVRLFSVKTDRMLLSDPSLAADGGENNG